MKRLLLLSVFIPAALITPSVDGIARVAPLPSRAPGCSSISIVNDRLENNQIITWKGGQCGGRGRIKVAFSGVAEHPNSGSNYAAVQIFDKNNAPMCNGADHQDHHFNTFQVRCLVQVQVNPYTTLQYRVQYSTDNVSDNPLPKLAVNGLYTPQPRRRHR
ncbi:MAG: hypothetical protein E7773_04030 [Sphingomonas sp.]|uniref:hypothetical protein n=1 Tax=Sphingomonas sp. TaxID=28214 RepID=UPI0011FB73CD|nr:hypothetical protein [Sphingomonas sp.]THD37212.1 MAG: hypothetical protein E7773_04030 [Sphingomonas sp.]